MPSRVQDLRANLAPTPTTHVIAEYRGRMHQIQLKHECFNPTGSIKDRTAAGLLMAMDRQAPLTPGTVVVESTSGNLGLGMAHLLTALECRFIAVIDPRTPPTTRELLEAAGVEICFVDEPDELGGFLLSRLRTVRAMCAANPNYRWPDQYGNPANPEIHRLTTGPEIADQGGPGLDAVYVAVSTGGTLAGIASHLHTLDRGIRIVAVDTQASSVTGSPPGMRLLAGIGATRPSAFLAHGSYTDARWISDTQAIAVCRTFREDTGVALGGSAGSVVRACLADLATTDPPRNPLCLCPDGGDRYQRTIYNDDWLEGFGVRVEVTRTMDHLRASGLRFRNT